MLQDPSERVHFGQAFRFFFIPPEKVFGALGYDPKLSKMFLSRDQLKNPWLLS